MDFKLKVVRKNGGFVVSTLDGKLQAWGLTEEKARRKFAEALAERGRS